MNKIREMLTLIFLISMLVTITTVITVGIADAIPVEEWNKTFGDGTATSVQQTTDGGNILTGGNYSSAIALLIKTDSLGNKQWNSTFRYGYASSVQQTKDGGYILTVSNQSSGIVWLIKTDLLGSDQWNRTFRYGYASSVQQTKDGGYVLVGYNATLSKYDTWIMKTDPNGKKLWNKTFVDENIFAANQTSDGGYILAGAGTPGLLLIKLDTNGNRLWSKVFHETGYENEAAKVVQQTKDGGYILAGYGFLDYFPNYDQNDALLIKTDSYGNKVWKRSFIVGDRTYVESIKQTKDGGYIFAGWGIVDDDPYYENIWTNGFLIKTGTNGNERWGMTFDKNNLYNDEIYSVQQTKDEGYIFAGNYNGIIWLVKVADKSINLLKNPGFETTYGSIPKYWIKYQTGYKATFTYPEIGRTNTGKSVAIKYVTKETGKVALWWQQSIPVIPSKQYKLSGYMKLSNVTGGRAGLRINWYKSDGSISRIDLITKSGTTPWTKYEKTFTSPSNAVKANVGGDLFNASGKVWFDDLSFIRTS